MTLTAVVEHIRIEARLAAAKNERESERLRLEKLKSRLRKKMEAAVGEKNDQNNERLLAH
jgi:hypothetical protein